MSDDIITRAIADAKEAVDALKLARLPTNDWGMAKRLIAHFGDRIRKLTDGGWAAYCPDAGYWLTGAEGEAMVRKYAHKTADLMWEEIAAVEQAIEARKTNPALPEIWDGLPRALRKALDEAGDAGGTNAMMAQAAPYLQAKPRDFDPDPNLICVKNGTLSPTMVKEPCFVAYDARGFAVAYVQAAKVRAGGPDVTLADWRLRNLGEGMFEIAAPESSVADAVELNELKAPLGEPTKFERNGLRLAHRLYHLDLKLLPHEAGHLITRQAPVVWDPAARCDRFREHMAICLPDRQDRDFFHRFMGYGMVGSNAAQSFLFMQGKGGDGKSTTMEVIVRVGGKYHHTANPQTFMEAKNRSAADASPDMADMAGDTRLVYCEEPQRGSRLNEALLKLLTGGLDVRSRQLNRDLFDWKPRFGLVMAFNDLVRIYGGDKGFWRRVRLILWTHEFTEEERLAAGDKVADLLTEAPGIFNYLLEGVAAFHRYGLEPHQVMKDRIESWRATTDPLGEWLRDRCELKVGAKERTKALFKDYKACLEHDGLEGREVLGWRQFQNRLTSEQITAVKADGGQAFRAGIELRPPEEWMLAPRGRPFNQEDER